MARKWSRTTNSVLKVWKNSKLITRNPRNMCRIPSPIQSWSLWWSYLSPWGTVWWPAIAISRTAEMTWRGLCKHCVGSRERQNCDPVWMLAAKITFLRVLTELFEQDPKQGDIFFWEGSPLCHPDSGCVDTSERYWSIFPFSLRSTDLSCSWASRRHKGQQLLYGCSRGMFCFRERNARPIC